jgi:hypothetical protein
MILSSGYLADAELSVEIAVANWQLWPLASKADVGWPSIPIALKAGALVVRFANCSVLPPA